MQRIARPYLKQLRDISKETVHLVLREDTHAVYIDKIEGPYAMTISSQVGARAAMYCTGVGKAILAFMEPEQQQLVMRQPMQAKTEFTVTTVDGLQNKLHEIRKQGYSLDEQEIEIGLCCIAAPLFGPNRRVIGGISIAGPEARLSKQRVELLVAPLLEAARNISQQMGHLE